MATTASLGVDQPTNPAKVDPNGNICITASADFCPDGHKPTQVFAKVMGPGEDIPGGPPSDATEGIITGEGEWNFPLIGGAVSYPPGTALPWNQVVIWREFECEPGVWFIEVLNRQGESSEGTNCSDKAAASFTANAAVAMAVFDTVADAWTIDGSGFSGEGLEAFNRRFRLQRDVNVAPGYLAWLVDADGVFQPRVELIGNAFEKPLELRLTYGGRVIAYALRREHWNPLGVNRFRLYSATGMEEPVEIPPMLEIVPG